MQKYLNQQQMQWLLVILCQCVFIGFVCSRALASIGMIGILVVSVFYHGLGGTFQAYYQKNRFLVISLYFWIVFLSGFYSDDISSWGNWVRIKLPYLILPIAFAPLARLEDKKFKLLLYGFIGTFVVSALIVLGRYYLNYHELNDAFNRGGALPMPFSHIRYTLMLAFAFFCTIYLLEMNALVKDKGRWLLWIVAGFIFLALHVLTVRSGLLGLYLGVFCLAVREIVRRKKYVLGVGILLLLTSLPFAANRFVPSFHNKMEYMHYDLEQYQKGVINEYSDAMRLVSMEIGIKEWKENIWIGVGAGDIKTEADKFYVRDYPQISETNRRLPHNQFVWMLATTGIVGLLCFLAAFFVPWLANGNYKYWIFTVLHLMLFSSFFSEHTFEEQMGTGFYLIFLLLFMNRFQAHE